jgi:general stress protein 26
MGEAFDAWAPEGGKGTVLEWSWVQDKMYAARSYWVVTTPKNGPPHPMPVWGVFIEDVFYFSTTNASAKAKHIARTGHATVHLESADMVVILKGQAKVVSDAALLESLAKAFLHKYNVEIVGKFPDQVMIAFEPQQAFAWQGFPESEFMRTMTRFDSI